MASASQISKRNLGRQSWASAPTGRRGSCRNHPSQRRTAERLRHGHEGWMEIGAGIIPKGASNLGQSLSQPAADSSLYTREPCPAGDEGRHPFQPRLPRQRLAKRNARKEELVKFGLCPMTALCSTAYWVRKSAESPARVPAEAVSTEQNGLEPRPAARQGASRARNCAAKSVFSFDGSTAVFFFARPKEKCGGKPSIFIDASPPRPLGGGNPSVALTGDSSLYTREP